MKERLITLGLALAALLCFYALLVPKPAPGAAASRPLSTDPGPDGYLGAWRWLASEHIPLVSLRDRYPALSDPTVAPAVFGNVLIMALPQQLPFKAAEWSALDEWLLGGNTLVILAALDDTPQWTLDNGVDPRAALQRASGMSFTTDGQAPSLREWLEPRPIEAVPQGEHPLLRGVQSLYAVSELPASRWRAHDDALPLRIARWSDASQGVLWLKAYGRGQIIVCALASLLSNRALDHADNALLLSNIIAWTRAEAGRVIFDDAHQGLVRFYDPARFFADPRLHRTLLWILLLWLVFVLGPQRLRAAPDRWQRVDETALIEASGRFYTQAVDPVDAARALLENFFNLLRQRLALPENGAPLWQWLDSQAAISAEQRRELQDLHARVCAGKRVDLTRLHNFLSTLQGQLT